MLEELLNNIPKSIENIKEIFEKIQKNNKISNELNNKEEEILLEVEKYYDDLLLKEDFL